MEKLLQAAGDITKFTLLLVIKSADVFYINEERAICPPAPVKMPLRLPARHGNACSARIAIIFILTGWLAGLQGFNARAQDPVYSQAFLSPIYLNPAATGTGDYDLRVSGIYRRQWWSIPSSMNFMAFSVDKFFPSVHTGLGLIATHSSEGYLLKNSFYGTYSYNICSGSESAAIPPKWFFTGGLQFGFAQTRINYNNLVFADQLNIEGYIPFSVSAANPPLNSGRFYPDFAAGVFFNYNFDAFNRLLIGFSDHHLNTPDESLTYSGNGIKSPLPMLLTGNIMYTNTNLNHTWSYSIAAIGYKQSYNNSFQVGAEVTQNEVNISLGMWYRGSVNFTQVNTFAVTLAIGLPGTGDNKEKFKIGVAQDAEVGNKAYAYTTGSSELGFVWDKSTYEQRDDDPCKPKIGTSICPTFVNYR